MYKAWRNQFYVFDIFEEMGQRMRPGDTLLLCDADCLCRRPLDELFRIVRLKGAALYDMGYPRDYPINGTTIEEMEALYAAYVNKPPMSPLRYYGGEFIGLDARAVAAVNREFPGLWQFNLKHPEGVPRFHEEAHAMSLLAALLNLGNDEAGAWVKRMWTGRLFRNIKPRDGHLAVWHLPAEKKFGLRRLSFLLEREGGIVDENRFWEKAGTWCGVPRSGMAKRACDLWIEFWEKWRK